LPAGKLVRPESGSARIAAEETGRLPAFMRSGPVLGEEEKRGRCRPRPRE